MKFEEALPLMRNGEWVKRDSWPEYYPVQKVTIIQGDFHFHLGPLKNSYYHWGFDDLLESDWSIAPVESEEEQDQEQPKKRTRRKKEDVNE